MTCNKSVNIFLLGLASSMKTDIRTSSSDQGVIMTFTYAFSVTLMVTFAIVSNIFSINTFSQAQIRSTTVGIYLLVYSCCSLFGILMLECRLFQLLDSLTYVPFFIICNIVSGLASIFTRICLWLNGIIALQRSLYSFEHYPLLNKFRSRANAPKQMFFVIISICLMHVHELICRVTLSDPVAEGKFVCQITYSTQLLTLNTIFTFLHLFVPILLHLLSDFIIMASISHRRATLHQTTYWSQWMREVRSHGHLFLAPTLAMICTLPQLVLALRFSCVDVNVKWLLRMNTSANLILYIPQAATFFIFIYHSQVYTEVFRNKSLLGKVFCRQHNMSNRIVPALTNTHRNEGGIKCEVNNKTKSHVNTNFNH